MRNPFKRTARPETARPTLRERLTATKAKAKQVLAVNAVILKPPPAPAPSADRAALVNYATFLSFERERVCAELYPHMGAKASRFVLTANAAELFFYPDGIGNGLSRAWRKVPPASTRAVKVLDLVGVDWRSDAADGVLAHVDLPSDQDTGERPPVPHRWPTIDSGLTEALDDLTRLDAGLAAMLVGLSDERDPDDVPGYEDLEVARDEALSRMDSIRAESLIGLQAKAKALLTRSVSEIHEDVSTVAQSLARDLLGATDTVIEPCPDPAFAAITEGRRLLGVSEALQARPQRATPRAEADAVAERDDALRALWAHNNNLILALVPTTAAGCRELARYAEQYRAANGVSISDDEMAVVRLIAASPLL